MISEEMELLLTAEDARRAFDEECQSKEAVQCERMRILDKRIFSDSQATAEIPISARLFLYATIRKIIQMASLTLLGLSLALFLFVYPRNYGTEKNTALIYDGKNRKFYQEKPAYQVLLTGDSLNLRPWQYHNLGGRIQDHLPTIALFFKQESLASYTVAKLNKTIKKQLQSHPDIAFVCGDTDVSSSGNSEWKMPPDQVALIHQYYENNMTSIIYQLKESVPYFAISGPFLLGEHEVHPGFYELTSQRIFKNKGQQLKNYVEMNENVCLAENVKYINMHTLFSHQLPPIWPFASWYVTADGEHPNQYGTSLMAREYALAIKEWLKLPDSAWRD